MIRKSGNRFSEKIMLRHKKLERQSVQIEATSRWRHLQRALAKRTCKNMSEGGLGAIAINAMAAAR
jgi:hypothetical protein